MVEWEDKDYPAYILELRTRGRFKVHMDGYDTRWDRIVDAEQIKGRAEGTVPAPPPPKRVARAMGLTPAASAQAKSAVSTFKVGHKVKVKWRGSTYSATIVEVVAPDKYKIHYNGHESAWDEVVPLERIQGR
ncbi:MAG: hypothetical protein HRU17_19785 [Polyangiaceae bacterium]|nr:hypothetical protein [Polyangiaceae bacterium]